MDINMKIPGVSETQAKILSESNIKEEQKEKDDGIVPNQENNKKKDISLFSINPNNNQIKIPEEAKKKEINNKEEEIKTDIVYKNTKNNDIAKPEEKIENKAHTKKNEKSKNPVEKEESLVEAKGILEQIDEESIFYYFDYIYEEYFNHEIGTISEFIKICLKQMK